ESNSSTVQERLADAADVLRRAGLVEQPIYDTPAGLVDYESMRYLVARENVLGGPAAAAAAAADLVAAVNQFRDQMLSGRRLEFETGEVERTGDHDGELAVIVRSATLAALERLGARQPYDPVFTVAYPDDSEGAGARRANNIAEGLRRAVDYLSTSIWDEFSAAAADVERVLSRAEVLTSAQLEPGEHVEVRVRWSEDADSSQSSVDSLDTTESMTEPRNIFDVQLVSDPTARTVVWHIASPPSGGIVVDHVVDTASHIGRYHFQDWLAHRAWGAEDMRIEVIADVGPEDLLLFADAVHTGFRQGIDDERENHMSTGGFGFPDLEGVPIDSRQAELPRDVFVRLEVTRSPVPQLSDVPRWTAEDFESWGARAQDSLSDLADGDPFDADAYRRGARQALNHAAGDDLALRSVLFGPPMPTMVAIVAAAWRAGGQAQVAPAWATVLLHQVVRPLLWWDTAVLRSWAEDANVAGQQLAQQAGRDWGEVRRQAMSDLRQRMARNSYLRGIFESADAEQVREDMASVVALASLPMPDEQLLGGLTAPPRADEWIDAFAMLLDTFVERLRVTPEQVAEAMLARVEPMVVRHLTRTADTAGQTQEFPESTAGRLHDWLTVAFRSYARSVLLRTANRRHFIADAANAGALEQELDLLALALAQGFE